MAIHSHRRKLRRSSTLEKLLPRLMRPDRDRFEMDTGSSTELWAEVQKLPDRQRVAVALRHIGGMTEPEIAKAMRITRGTVSSHLRAAHVALRKHLDNPQRESEA